MPVKRGLLAQLQHRFTRDIGIDLGTANTLVHVSGKGVVIREPSVVAIDLEDGRVLAVGEEAKRMLGRTPANIAANASTVASTTADFRISLSLCVYIIYVMALRKL